MSTFRKFWENRPRTDYFETFNDFILSGDYAAADWTITNTGSPTIAIDTDGIGGLLVATTGGTDTNSTSHQHDQEAFKFTLGKAFEFETRFALDDVVDSIFMIGLAVTDTTPLDATDRLVFKKEDTESTVSFQATANGSAVSSLDDFATLTNNVFTKVGFYYDGKVQQTAVPNQPAGTIDVFLNDRRVGSVPVTNAPDTEIAITFHLVTGKTGAVAAAIDYIRAVQER